MKNRKYCLKMVTMMTALLMIAGGGVCLAANGSQTAPETGKKGNMETRKPAAVVLSPELAAKRMMVRKQQDQRITPEKRKAAVEALKAERLKVYNAKQAVKQLSPPTIDSK